MIQIDEISTLDDEKAFLDTLDIEKYLSRNNNDKKVIERIADMIFNRLEVLWEYTWIDGELRSSSAEEIAEWKKLEKMQTYINTVINGDSKSQD